MRKVFAGWYRMTFWYTGGVYYNITTERPNVRIVTQSECLKSSIQYGRILLFTRTYLLFSKLYLMLVLYIHLNLYHGYSKHQSISIAKISVRHMTSNDSFDNVNQ